MGNNYKTTSILPPGRKKMSQAIQSTDILPESEPKQRLGGFAPTDIIPNDKEDAVAAKYKVVLTDQKDFEEVILAEAETRNEAYDAFKAWFAEYKADPRARNYPPNLWAVCTRAGELSWKTLATA